MSTGASRQSRLVPETRGGDQTAPAFEIRVVGDVPDTELLRDLGVVVAGTERPSTVLHGIPDQSALQAVLARLQELGLEVLEVRLDRAPTGRGGAVP